MSLCWILTPFCQASPIQPDHWKGVQRLKAARCHGGSGLGRYQFVGLQWLGSEGAFGCCLEVRMWEEDHGNHGATPNQLLKKIAPALLKLGQWLPFFAWETMILVLAIWPFDTDHPFRTNLFCLVPKVDGIGAPLSRCTMMLSQAMDPIKNRNATVNKKRVTLKTKVCFEPSVGPLWTTATEHPAFLYWCIPAKRDFQTASYTFANVCSCWGWKLNIVLNISVETWRDVTLLPSILVFHTHWIICISLSYKEIRKS